MASAAAEDELRAIFERTYGSGRKTEPQQEEGGGFWSRAEAQGTAGDAQGDISGKETDASGGQMRAGRQGGTVSGRNKKQPEIREYLLVDGYNMIFAWDDLRDLAAHNIDAARDRLTDLMCGYQGSTGVILILVFDAWKVSGGQRRVSRWNNIYVVYTKEAETADAYIEKTVHEIGRRHRVTVATSDGLEQMIILGEGAVRMTAAELREAVQREARSAGSRPVPAGGKNYLLDHASAEVSEQLEKIRLGSRTDSSPDRPGKR